MAERSPLLIKTFIAGGAVVANTLAKFGAADDTVVPAAAATDAVIGVFEHDAASGARVDVMLAGIADVKAGGAITRGDHVVSDAAAEGVAMAAAATIKMAAGQAMRTAADGDLFPMMINPYKAVTA